MENASHGHAAAQPPLRLLFVYGTNRDGGKRSGFPDLPRHHGRRDQVGAPARAQTAHAAGPARGTALRPAARAVRAGAPALRRGQEGLAALAAGTEYGDGGKAAG